MDFPRENSRSCKKAATQTCDIKESPDSNPDICGLCGNEVFSVSSPNEIPIGSDLPGNICQCFFSPYDDYVPGDGNFDGPKEASFSIEENTSPSNIEISNSQYPNIHHAIEKCYVEESCNKSKTDTSSSEEPKTSEYSFSSTGYVSSPSEVSSGQSLIHSTGTTPVSSGKSSKSSPSTGISVRSNDYALSLLEQPFNQDSSNQKDINSFSPGEESKNSSSIEKDISSSYTLPLGEHSLDENLTRNISPSSAEGSNRNLKIENDETSTQSLCESSNLDRLNVSECRSNKSFSSDHSEISYNWTRRESDCQFELNVNRNENMKCVKSIPLELIRFRSPYPRPECPTPFPTLNAPSHPLYRNPAINIPIPGPSLPRPQQHAQTIQSYGISAMNMPINRTDFPARFPVVSRPQLITSHDQRPVNEGNGKLSQKLVTDAKKGDPEGNCDIKDKRIKDWLEEIKKVPPLEDASASDYARSGSIVENENDEEIVPCLLETSTDERSSTEISEEEYRKQMAIKCPPRRGKKK